MNFFVGDDLKIGIFGQSHAEAIGVVIEGLPAGRRLDLEALAAFLARRAPGRNAWSTPRKEPDAPELLSGLVEGRTCGAPLAFLIRNRDQRSGDYESLKNTPRPGHADYAAQRKYGGFQDARGGGAFSGRMTAPLCIAGGVCLQLLEEQGVSIGAHAAAIAGVEDRPFDPVSLTREQLYAVKANPFPTQDIEKAEEMCKAISLAGQEGDSVGGVIECAALGLPAGLGGPLFGGLEGRISRLVFAVPAVKGVEFGAGFASAGLRGSENNDAFCCDGERVVTRTNRHGGILGGISTGMPLLFRAAVKPTPSIAKEQETVDLSARKAATLSVGGRHDPCIVPRAVPCIEAAAAVALYDAWLDRKKEC